MPKKLTAKDTPEYHIGYCRGFMEGTRGSILEKILYALQLSMYSFALGFVFCLLLSV